MSSNKRKKINLLLFFIFLLFFISNSCESIKVVTSPDFPPWENIVNDKLVGIDVEIMERIGVFLGEEIEWIHGSFDDLILMLVSGKADACIASMASNPERLKSVNFSTPYWQSQQSVLVRKDDTFIQDEFLNTNLENKIIGVSIGSTSAQFCEGKFKNIIFFNSISESILELLNHGIDFILTDTIVGQSYASKYKDKIKTYDDVVPSEETSIAVPKNRLDLLSKINSAVKYLQDNGEIRKIVLKNMNIEIEEKQTLFSAIKLNLIDEDRYKLIYKGLKISITIVLLSLLIGLVFGTISGVIITFSNYKIFNNLINSKVLDCMIKFLSYFFKGYVQIIRGTPVICQLFAMQYLVCLPLGLSRLIAAVLTFGFNSAAYISEIIRNALITIDDGQIEASCVLGIPKKTLFSHILIPQVINISLPLFCNEAISLLKETAVAGIIGVVELSRTSEIIRAQTFSPVIPLITVSIIYLILTSIISLILHKFEKKYEFKK